MALLSTAMDLGFGKSANNIRLVATELPLRCRSKLLPTNENHGKCDANHVVGDPSYRAFCVLLLGRYNI